jgi:hypothetical protein
MSDVVERVAEAIWRASLLDDAPGNCDWAYGPEEGQWGRDTFRRMADAALAALQLTQEWGVKHAQGIRWCSSELTARAEMIHMVSADERRQAQARGHVRLVRRHLSAVEVVENPYAGEAL